MLVAEARSAHVGQVVVMSHTCMWLLHAEEHELARECTGKHHAAVGCECV